ncbi:C39 family peptidase [uncultured Thermanaerothrix sp.]|uniref:C39 family peptidase n=1 Tax=uncultured Thermanaerothrix sp. TaxID=1195149 RepID=UPI00263077AF|nr:C39 family peptidase [uncultured Thermanaerothrix sp.]
MSGVIIKNVSRFWRFLGLVLLIGGVGLGTVWMVPGVRERVVWHLEAWRVQVRYALKPPQEAVFVPESTLPTMPLVSSPTALPPTATPSHPIDEAVNSHPTATPTVLPTPTPTPLPPEAYISGGRYYDQHGLWNYCAPATLAIALSYWGWQGDRTDIGRVVKPFEKDKNVMPYELADYVEKYTGLRALVRAGGTLDLLKGLVAAGFPVMIEKGVYLRDYNGRLGWMGHYTVVSGYQDATQRFITQDAYFSPDYLVTYDDLLWQWRSFNYVFLVVYPPEREAEVLAVLGPYADVTESYRRAMQVASYEASALSGLEQFFALFNYGTSLVNLQDYAGAAHAYDQAFTLMANLPEDKRPWRIMWYQTGPYFAYYYTGRYWDVIRLADTTIGAADQPYIEESFIWRARARLALGDTAGAAEDVRTALEYHPGFIPAVEMAQAMHLQP